MVELVPQSMYSNVSTDSCSVWDRYDTFMVILRGDRRRLAAAFWNPRLKHPQGPNIVGPGPITGAQTYKNGFLCTFPTILNFFFFALQHDDTGRTSRLAC